MDNSIFQICGLDGQWVCLAKFPEPEIADERRIMMRTDTNEVIVVRPVGPTPRLRVTAGPFTTQEIEDAARKSLFTNFVEHSDAVKAAIGHFMSQVAIKQAQTTQHVFMPRKG